MCVPYKFLTRPAGQDWRNERSVGVKDEQEGSGPRKKERTRSQRWRTGGYERDGRSGEGADGG